MNYIKCPKCGREDPAFDYAHVCGPVEVKRSVMNERVEKLAELCGFRPSPSIYDRNQSFDIEKFAELIVRECIDKITTYDLVPGHSAKWEDIYDIHARLLQDLAEDLKEHFGVEE